MPPIEIDPDRLRAAVTDAITAGRGAPPGVRIELRGAAAVPVVGAEQQLQQQMERQQLQRPAGAPVSGSGYYLGFKKGRLGAKAQHSVLLDDGTAATFELGKLP
eukprot:SAG22_NODE_11533_length_480_cov_0.813648_1_plen_103_part_01